MADFVFTSPGVKFKERDLSFVTRNVGITTLGLVGETLKGPAFEPVFVQDKNQFRDRFGGQSISRFNNGDLKFHLPYVANSYLDESSQLWVTRVLGLSGYNAGTAWAITLDAGVDPSTITSGTTNTGTETFENNEYRGVRINSSGQTGVIFSGFTKINSTDFEGLSYEFEVTDLDSVTGSGTTTYTTTLLQGTSYSDYENMVLGVIRSKARVQDVVNETPETIYDTYQENGLDITILTAGDDLFGTFELEATNENVGQATGSTETYVVSMNPNSSSFLPNVLGRDPRGNSKIWVEAAYPDLIRMLDVDGMEFSGLTAFGIEDGTIAPFGYGIKDTLIEATSEPFTDYETGFKTPETPWVVSQIRGNKIDRLFKFISISDGNSANREIKISIANINPITREFDVQVRDFNDTDDNPVILESFVRCTLIEQQNNFIGRRIGTIDGEYDLNSRYIMLELENEINPDAFPAGFEGYMEKDWSDDGGVAPKVYYKTKYEDNERIRRVYLGISELGYSTENLRGRGINQNYYNFFGLSGFKQGKGFHMDVEADSILNGNGDPMFIVGEGRFQTIEDTFDTGNPYLELNSRKFTLVPAGGFDGWNVYRDGRSNTEGFQMNGIFDGVDPNVTPNNDFQAWETAIETFANPEEVTINLFATPGINWSDNNTLIKDTIEIIETQRTDTLYIIDSPDLPIEQAVGERRVDVDAARNIVDLLDDAEIDSNYACTYFPWIQFRDNQNNSNIFIPPTGEVVKAMAFTDNTSFPWFAPAGLNRGVTNARRSKYKLSLEARDILYAGRINPIADFADVGTAIFGQKTLQLRESALDRINVRRLLLQIKVLISNIAIRLIFEQNDQATIDQFLQKATPVLDTIRRERGLQDFRIKMDDSNNTPETLDRNELYGEIFLKPTRALEYIGITFTITPSGAAFEDFGA
ncbi:MAG: hypothetical protein ACOC22_02100 [bacterium]